MKKKKKKSRNWKYINDMKDKVINITTKVWIPNPTIFKPIRTDSWYNCSSYLSNQNNVINFNDTTIPTCKKLRSAKKIIIKLNNFQKKVLNNWFNAYIIMYNTTVRYIKNLLAFDWNKEDLNFYNIRDILSVYKEEIIINSQNKYIKKDTKIRSHMLDGAIKLAITNFKSALTNFENGNIKKFRVRYWKHNKDTKILNIEKCYFINDGISILGTIDACYDNYRFKLTKNDIECDSILRYDSKLNEYCLYTPFKTKSLKKCINPIDSYIALDPGVRVFMTGVSNKEVVQIGDNVSKEIKTYLNRIDNLEKIKDDKRKKHKKERLYNRKIVNKVDDLHWKSINYLTNNYSTIFIGDMSVQGIVSNKTSKLNDMTKRIAQRIKFYKYRERLKYKCIVKKIKYKVVNESYTSKMCSQCGWLNEKLGGDKIFKCKMCQLQIDRDINGCRNMIIKSI